MRVLTPTLSPTLATESATVRLFFLSALLCSVNKAACDFAHARPIMHCIHLVITLTIYIRSTVLAPGWPRATRKRSRPDHTCKYIIRIYTYTYNISTCIHMYTYVYTWSKLAYCESNKATETPREATEAPRRPRRSPLSPTKATEIIAKTALQIPAF